MYKLSDFYKNSDIRSSFIMLLRNKWQEIHNRTSVFRYKIENIQEKYLDGYFMQLNPSRGCNRRTPEHIDSICQPFNKEKFNFTKVRPDEIIFRIEDNESNKEYHTILVNVSPISQYHSLLCPYVERCLPQIVTCQSLELTIKIMFIVNDHAFRIGYNSLCAFASVNHLHYHLFLEKTVLPVESVKCKRICGPVYSLIGYPINGFCCQIRTLDNAKENAKDLFKLIELFMKKSIAHNIFMTRGLDLELGSGEVLRVLIWPRKSSVGAKQLAAFNVALCELSGWFPVYNENDFNRLQREDLETELAKWKYDNMDALCDEIKLLYR